MGVEYAVLCTVVHVRNSNIFLNIYIYIYIYFIFYF